jgi:hypothetical protein
MTAQDLDFKELAAKIFRNKDLAAIFRPEKPMGDAPEDTARLPKSE